MRIETVVVGMDFSSLAIATARWVATTFAPEAKLIVTHAQEPGARPPFLVANTLPQAALETDARAYAESCLNDIAVELGAAVTRSEVRFGHAHDVLAQAARRYHADLIVVGAHGERSRDSVLLGTTADALVRTAPVPVLVGGRIRVKERTRVVAGATDSAVRGDVLTWGHYAAQQLGGRLTVLYAVEPSAYGHMLSMAAAHARGNERVERTEIQGELRWQATHWLRECTAVGIDTSHVDARVEEGLAAEAILDVARDEHAALIVIGRHDTPRRLPAILGRTVRHVLHGARCDVLVVPARQESRA
jgi:nucleotide-binding universal stress UspA family protein